MEGNGHIMNRPRRCIGDTVTVKEGVTRSLRCLSVGEAMT